MISSTVASTISGWVRSASRIDAVAAAMRDGSAIAADRGASAGVLAGADGAAGATASVDLIARTAGACGAGTTGGSATAASAGGATGAIGGPSAGAAGAAGGAGSMASAGGAAGAGSMAAAGRAARGGAGASLGDAAAMRCGDRGVALLRTAAMGDTRFDRDLALFWIAVSGDPRCQHWGFIARASPEYQCCSCGGAHSAGAGAGTVPADVAHDAAIAIKTITRNTPFNPFRMRSPSARAMIAPPD